MCLACVYGEVQSNSGSKKNIQINEMINQIKYFWNSSKIISVGKKNLIWSIFLWEWKSEIREYEINHLPLDGDKKWIKYD